MCGLSSPRGYRLTSATSLWLQHLDMAMSCSYHRVCRDNSPVTQNDIRCFAGVAGSLGFRRHAASGKSEQGHFSCIVRATSCLQNKRGSHKNQRKTTTATSFETRQCRKLLLTTRFLKHAQRTSSLSFVKAQALVATLPILRLHSRRQRVIPSAPKTAPIALRRSHHVLRTARVIPSRMKSLSCSKSKAYSTERY